MEKLNGSSGLNLSPPQTIFTQTWDDCVDTLKCLQPFISY